jgi:hypothetical protein
MIRIVVMHSWEWMILVETGWFTARVEGRTAVMMPRDPRLQPK